MPKYHVELTDGRKFEVEADSPPSEADIVAHLGGGGAKPPAAEPPSALSRFGSEFLAKLPQVQTWPGAIADAVSHPRDTLKRIGENAARSADISGSIEAQRINPDTPIAHLVRGDVAGAAGGLTSIAGQLAAGQVLPPMLKRGSLRLMQSALKPTETLVKARTGAGFPSKSAIAQAVLDEGRIVSPRSLGNAQEALDATDAAAHAKIQAGAGQGVTVDPFDVTRAIGDTNAKTFGKQINAQPDTAAVNLVRENFANNPHVSDPVTGMAQMPADLAHEFAINTGKNLRGKFGRLGGATVEAEKAGRASITGQLRAKIPDLEPLWQQEARQMTTRDALESAVGRTANRDPMGLSGIVGMVKNPGLAVGALADRSAWLKSIGAQAMKHATGPAQSARAAILARLLAASQKTEEDTTP